MPTWFETCNAIYWLSLTIWVAAILGAGIAAAGVFSTLPTLGLRIERFEPALDGDLAQHGRVAGGMVMEPIFTFTDFAQAGAAALVVLMLVLQVAVFRMRLLSPANLLRTLCIIAAVALVGYHMTSIAPRMNRELRSYWHALENADRTAMQAHRTAFDQDHVLADRLFKLRLALVIVAIAASAAAFTPSAPLNRGGLEKPQLSR